MSAYMRVLMVMIVVLGYCSIHAQESKSLPEVNIQGTKPYPVFQTKNQDFLILEGKKNEIITMDNMIANKATNNARQVFSKVAGLNIFETDGSGIQIGVSTRGLSPNRSWEFNNRQNGYDISADNFGYPEAYYNPPIEAVERIEIVRGSGALQYGSQMGGMLNYILKHNKSSKPFNMDLQATMGSYGMASLYAAIGGSYKKWNYTLYNHIRKGDGWRDNGYYDIRNTHGYIEYKPNEHSSISMELTNMNYQNQLAGGLTDKEFSINPRQSNRSRNWFGTPWTLANIQYTNKISSRYQVQLSAFALWGERNSVGYLAAANIKDTLLPTGQYNARQVDRDAYRNFGLEWRNRITYRLGNKNHDLSIGARIYHAHTDRNQRGRGTSGSDFDLNEFNGKYPVALDFNTQNIAFFAENTFHITDKFSISPGVRYENIQSSMEGRMNIVNNVDVQAPKTTITRNMLLSGISFQYLFHQGMGLYGSATQSFRPVLFSDLLPSATTDIVNPNLKDVSGWNMDIGLRGNVDRVLKYDVSLFYLISDNKIGTIRKYVNDDPTQATYQYRTNLGTAIHRGVEAFMELDITQWLQKDQGFGQWSIYSSGSFIDASYGDFYTYAVSGTVPNATISQTNLNGNKVEYAPAWIWSTGLQYQYKRFGLHLQNRTTSKVYTDANNTELSNAAATTGAIGGYSLWDIAMQYRLNGKYNIGFGINNFTNQIYATRRSGGYPGPGLVPGEGRTWYFSFGFKL